ncbi:MAG: hypothetical protein NC123_09185 [Butyrivibrio sp.]|nr:hypothetical protein [Acetatifactor muris]MCM1559707.1 hypothetical protein [Butyrivibrio sp.]
MPVMDEFKEERAAMKNGTPRQKLAYFFDYYKWHVVLGVVAVIFAVSLICQIITNKETAFDAMLLNASPYDASAEEENAAAFAAYAGIDAKKSKIIYDTSVQFGSEVSTDYYAAQQIMVHVSAAEVDVMAGDTSYLLQYAYMGDFYDLRELLSSEQLDKYRDFFYYIDGTVAEEIEAARKNYESEYEPVYGDPMRPEDMQDPIPVGLFLPEDCFLLQNYFFRGEQPVISVLINTKHPETASAFLDFLLQ